MLFSACICRYSSIFVRPVSRLLVTNRLYEGGSVDVTNETREPGDEMVFLVVVNDEEQYSVWPADREPPAGWHAGGFRGSREECLAHIDEVWTDITPKSVRDRLADRA